ncbi:MAG TPA: carbonic anhydrase family protein [Deltaproteobacteria bacterium]|nr:carbonic anhydrase family protein [Deltaproteobacteria bacterium]
MVRRRLVTAIFLAILLSVTPAIAGSGKAHWGYEGKTGPEHWGELSKEFELCSKGKEQSPVDISNPVPEKMKPLKFSYKKAKKLHVVNNGHTIKVSYPAGSIFDAPNGKKYELLQFHFHAPSEHTVGGKAYPMEMHLVHKSKDGKIAVVGVFIKEGAHNKAIEKIWEELPEKEGETEDVEEALSAAELLPASRSYYHYNGSFTTPPCTEGVNWFVITEPIELSKKQIDKFRSIMDGNARPVQPLNERVIHIVK